MSQRDQVLKHMRERGSITARIAVQHYGIYRLAARIDELRRIHCINTVLVSRSGKRFAAYSLVG